MENTINLKGTWEFITNKEGINKSDTVIIDELGKYYRDGEQLEHLYNIILTRFGAKIHIRKNDISNKNIYCFEVIDFINDDSLSGMDENKNSIEYRRKSY